MVQPNDFITVIIETPMGSAQKYDYEPGTNCFKLKKMMPAGMVFPFDFGFVPGTKGDDGDPLDIIVISEAGTFPGCCMDCRIIGGMMAEQTERNGERMRNDRFLAVPIVSQVFGNIHDVDGLPHGMMAQLEQFFKNYNEQAGKQFRPLRTMNAKEALQAIVESKK